MLCQPTVHVLIPSSVVSSSRLCDELSAAQRQINRAHHTGCSYSLFLLTLYRCFVMLSIPDPHRELTLCLGTYGDLTPQCSTYTTFYHSKGWSQACRDRLLSGRNIETPALVKRRAVAPLSSATFQRHTQTVHQRQNALLTLIKLGDPLTSQGPEHQAGRPAFCFSLATPPYPGCFGARTKGH